MREKLRIHENFRALWVCKTARRLAKHCMLSNYCNFDETLWILIWAPLWGSPCVWEVFESWIDCSCFIYIMYCLVKRDREIWSLHKLSLPETNVSDVWIGKLLFYRIFSNLLLARLTSHKIIKRVFNTKILSFIRALNFSHCDWRAWNVPSYWIWGKNQDTCQVNQCFLSPF